MKPLVTKGFHFYENGRKCLIRGVTYGPFRPDDEGHPYPDEEILHKDFTAMKAIGINTVRIYTSPSEPLSRVSNDLGIRLLVDVPWPKHLDVYNNSKLQELCLRMVREGVERVREYPNVMGLFLGNEIPPDLLRWAGIPPAEKFLRRLYEEAKEYGPDLLIGFSNFPSTEYLPLGFFDFIGFNVYLEDPNDLRRYLMRLRHLYPDKPILMSETGADTLGASEEEQARTLRDSLEAAYEVGLAGAFVFSWTDEWHTGGYDIKDWAFGIVDEERSPKKSLATVREVFRSAPHSHKLKHIPRISVVVASYNGGKTLRQCLRSLLELDYPDYEVIVVDDGSTDDTAEILKDFPAVKVVSQENRGLSAARNAGIQAAGGEIVAFTDSDCYADEHWLYHLAIAMELGGYTGVGGPNLTPHEPNPLHRCVAYGPGHATHVLFDAEEAEHVPGCNMAFHREALLQVKGFDPAFRKAGDDVDVIWRLRDRGHRIGFAPGAFVWHHRRSTFRDYWKQQIGYGEAEALLIHKHPYRFNDRGQSLWRGMIYSPHEVTSPFRKPAIHYGVFCSAGYQCLYEQRGGFFTYLVTSLEWWLASLALILAGVFSQVSLLVGLLGVAATLSISALRAWRRFHNARDLKPVHFFAVWLLWISQPFVRVGMRYWARMRGRSPSRQFRQALKDINTSPEEERFLKGRVQEYWGEDGVPGRLAILRKLEHGMAERQWLFTANSGWEPWDMSVVVSWWFKSLITTAEEDHGAGTRLLRIRLKLMPSSLLWFAAVSVVVLSGLVAMQDTLIARIILIGSCVVFWLIYRQAFRGRDLVKAVAHSTIVRSGYLPYRANEPLPKEEDSKESSVPDIKTQGV